MERVRQCWSPDGSGLAIALHISHQGVNYMNNRVLWFLSSTLIVLCVGMRARITPAANLPRAKPNVIIVLVDDAGYGDFSCHGTTPA